MRKKSLFVFLIILSVSIFSNVFVKEEMVYFTFEVDAEQVYLAGNFNNWSTTSTEMEFKDGVWVVALELEPGEYQYKFVVNGEKWVEDPNAPSYVDDGYGGENGAFKLVLQDGSLVIEPIGKLMEKENGAKEYEINKERKDTIFVDEEGYVVIRYYNPDADYVMIAGDFNNWDAESDEMYGLGDGWWEAILELEPGEYQYKFVVNGEEWVEDPNAFAYVPDGFGGKNSVLKVCRGGESLIVKAPESVVEGKKEIPLGVSVVDGKVYFKVEKREATKAFLAGSFNNWDSQAIEMKNVDGYWQVSMELNPGKYQYKYVFLINGNQVWQEDPNAPGYVPDGYGGKNGAFELVLEGGNLVIKKSENSSKSSVNLSGIYNFTVTYKYDSTTLIKGIGFSNKLSLIFKPSDELEFSIGYSGANIEYGVINFKVDKWNIMAHYNLPVDLPFNGIQSGVYLSFAGVFVDLGAESGAVPFIIGARYSDFSLLYGDFYDRNGILLGYNFSIFDADVELYGGYFFNLGELGFYCEAKSNDWNTTLQYFKNKFAMDLSLFNWDLVTDFSMTDLNYNISMYIPVVKNYKIFGGYSHTNLSDKYNFGLLYDTDYTLGLKARMENSNIYFDIFGKVVF
ncbi:isoamylase early set domain-containing protein [Thermosipho sp. 1070]|uniref:isoamylase early set domain-containing protein n=1 Tax=Thermosipho sp. 1070 TaxID=1437364 RepID=UPI000949489A|nr:isoamylase early set domain-containing protein [Thermosipho sp. 1070]ANQ53570.1 glycoside hydrolase family 13 [Thermosipho sp. 1070]